MGIPAPLGVAAAGLPNAGDQCNAYLGGTLSAVGPTAPFAFRGPMNLAIWASINTALTTAAGSLAPTVASATGLAIGNAINSANVPRGATIGNLVGTTVTLALPPITLYGTINTAAAQIGGLASTAGLLGATVTVPSNNEQVTLPANTTVTAIIQVAVPPTNINPGVPGIVQLSAPATAAPVMTGPVPFQFAPTGNVVTVTGADAAASFTGAAIKYDATVQVERSFDGGATWLVCNIGGAGALAQYLDLSSVSLTFGEPEKNVLYRLNCIEYTSGTINYRFSQTGGAAESLAIGPLTSG